jgi:hypothetical protein
LDRAEAALTCRKGDFAEDLSEQGKQRKTSGTSWQADAAIRSLYTKTSDRPAVGLSSGGDFNAMASQT